MNVNYETLLRNILAAKSPGEQQYAISQAMKTIEPKASQGNWVFYEEEPSQCYVVITGADTELARLYYGGASHPDRETALCNARLFVSAREMVNILRDLGSEAIITMAQHEEIRSLLRKVENK